MNKRLCSVGAAVLVLLLMGMQGAQSQEVVIRGQTVQPVPPATLAEYLDTLKAGAWFKAASKLTPEAVQPEIEKVRQESGLSIEVFSENYRQACFDEYTERLSAVRSVDGASIWYSVGREKTESSARVWVLYMERTQGNSSTNSQYVLTPENLAALDFDYVECVEVVHPLKVENCEARAQNVNFASFAADFCERYGVEYAIKSNGDELISINLRNRSFVECLETAASVSARPVHFSPDPYSRDTDIADVVEQDQGLPLLSELLRQVREDVKEIQHQRVRVMLPLPAVSQR
ncbi:MAG: hypothetical protein H6839_15560 [Planctomycetes bacterium]|nr:hypothetical protein [Planctomycetota bacterium]